MSTIYDINTQYRIGAVDFEEQLEHGLGRNATITDIWSMTVYCEEEDFKRNRRGWLGAQKPLTNVRIGWISPTEERDHLNIEKVDSSVCCNAHSLLNIWKCEM